MNVKLYSFAKRRNSTLRPIAAAGYDFEAIINDGQSTICNPQLTLKGDAQSVLPSFNYVYINKWNRYYYINDWRYMGNGLWTAYCDVDVLASWRTDIIENTPGYIGRWNDTNNVSANVHDGYYPATGYYEGKRDRVALPFTANPTQGSYVIGVIGKNANYGSTTYYAVSSSVMATLITNLAGNESLIIWNGIESVTSSILKSIVNPIQYIVSCKWYPFTITEAYGVVEEIRLWTWDTGVSGVHLDSSIAAAMRIFSVTYDEAFTIPASPAGETHSRNFPKYAPYWKMVLFTPIWGIVDIPVDIVESRPHYSFDIHVNVISGMADLIMYADVSVDGGKETMIFKRSANMGIDIPLAQVSTNYVQMAKDIVGLVSAGQAEDRTATRTGVAGTNAMSIASGIINAVNDSLSPSVYSKGESGNGFNYDIDSMYIVEYRYETVGTDILENGVPAKLYVVNLRDYFATILPSKYVQFDIVHFKSAGTALENSQVEEMLLGGIFIE